MLYNIIVILLSVLLTALVAGNNLSAAVGTLIGSRILSKTGGVLIGIAGFSAGLLLQGNSLHGTAASLLPRSDPLIAYALIVALVIFGMATYFRVPLSLIMALVGTSVGISLKLGYTINIPLVLLIVGTWVLAPLLSISLAFLMNRQFIRTQPKDVWRFALSMKLALIAVSFVTAFTLGANTLGFIEQVSGLRGISVLYLVVGIAAGSVFLSKGVIKRVGQEMYLMRYTNAFVSLIVSSALVEGATLLGIPLSNTQTLTSSVFGTGLSYRNKLMEMRPFLITVATWVISPLAGLVLGLLV
jgi:PiT family inorganic phosphate transporter